MTIVRSLLVAVAIVAAPMSAAPCQGIPSAVASWTQPSSTVPFELFRTNRIVVDGAINGHAVDFLLDTGAGVTTVDRAFAKKIGLPVGQKIEALGSGGTVEAEIVTDVTLSIGNLKLDKAPVVIMDLSGVAKALGRPMDVVLGREFFDNAIVRIDWQAKQLTLSSPAGFVPPPGATRVDLGKSDMRLNFIDVAIGNHAPEKAHFDLGNGGSLSLPYRFWKDKLDLANLPYALSEAGGVGGMRSVRLVTIPRVTYAGVTFENVPAALSQQDNPKAVDEANAGIGLMKQFKMTMDLGHARVFLERLPGPPTFLRDRSGVRTDFDGKELTLAFVSPGSPAAKAGLKKGDRIVAVDGQRVGPGYFDGPAGGWNQRPAGEKVALETADGRKVTVTLADYF